MNRTAEIKRTTKETDISVFINLDGSGKCNIDTGVGFFDHMLNSFCVHSRCDLNISCKGDTFVDCHHTVEDVGIVLGQAVFKAIGDKKGINRYGSAFIPMDESLGFCALDISNRPFLVFNCEFSSDKIGEMDTQMAEEFFRAFSFNAGITLHLKCEYGKNDHHKSEALFKAFAAAFKKAKSFSGYDDFSSSKGVI